MSSAAPCSVVCIPREVLDSSCCLAHRAEMLVLRSNGHTVVYCEQCDQSAPCAPEIRCLWPA